ncbi:hypothetical protein M1271_00325 [Patescibacteria group bacterium]|nr:hypothetical protein [Patescibacteria group bacterium]
MTVSIRSEGVQVGVEGLFSAGPITTEVQNKLRLALNRPLGGLNGRQILAGNLTQLEGVNDYLVSLDNEQNGQRNSEFYQRNKELIEEFRQKYEKARDSNGEIWDEDRFRSFLVGFELDTQLQAVALDNPNDSLRAQVEFLLTKLDNPDSLEIQRAHVEARRLHNARLLSVYPDRIGDVEEVVEAGKKIIDREMRSCHGDWMTQGRGNARGSLENPEALKAYLEELIAFRQLVLAVDDKVIDPTGPVLRQGFEALRKDEAGDGLLQTLISASYVPSDEVISEDKIIKAQGRLDLMIDSNDTRAAQVIHGGILAGSALNIVSGRLETDQNQRINSKVARFIAARKGLMRQLLTDPLYSPEAAEAQYQDVDRLPLQRDLHILQRLAQLSPQKEEVLEEAIKTVNQEIRLRDEFSDELEKGADIFAERIIAPVAKRGKRYVDVKRRLDRVFSEEKTKTNRDARYRLRQDLRGMQSFLKTSEGRKFLKNLEDESFVSNVAEMAKKGDKRLRARVVNDNGEKRKVYDYQEGRFLSHVGRWLPSMIEYRQLKRRLYEEYGRRNEIVPQDSRNLPDLDKLQVNLPLSFEDRVLPQLEDMLDAGPRRRIERVAVKMREKLKDDVDWVGRTIDIPTIDRNRIKIIARETIERGNAMLGRKRQEMERSNQTAATGSDTTELDKVISSPDWESILPPINLNGNLRKRINRMFRRGAEREEVHGRQNREIPIHGIKSKLSESVLSTSEGRLITGLESIGDVTELNENRMETSLRVLRSAIEEGMIPRLEGERVENPNISYSVTSNQNNEIRELIYRDVDSNREVHLRYIATGGQRQLLHADFRVYPLGRDENVVVGQREFEFSMDLTDGRWKIVSDLNTDPKGNYSRFDSTISNQTKGLEARCVQIRGLDGSDGIHKSAKREWSYLRKDVALSEGEEVTHIESHFIPLGSGDGAVDLPSIFTQYADYVNSVLPVREAQVEQVTGAEGFDSPPWRETVSLLEQISWNNENDDHNYAIKKAAFDWFQGINQGNLPIVQESLRRIEKGERPKTKVEDYTRQIDYLREVINRFEEITETVDPARLREMLAGVIEMNDVHPEIDTVKSFIDRINRAHLAIEDYTAVLPANFSDREAAFVDYWFYLTNRFNGINEFLRRRGQEPDMLLYLEKRRLEENPLIGVLEKRVYRSGEEIRYAKKQLDSILPEQRFMIDEKWLKVLDMMDSMDDREQDANFGYPHLEQVNWYNYHLPTQGAGLPFPNEDGSSSGYQQQMMESVNWVRRLAREIDSQDILDFPRVEEKVTFGVKDKYLKEHDPDWSRAVREVSELLERMAPDNQFALDFTLSEDKYIQLDSPRKKLAAFLLLRKRLSNVIAGTIGSFEFKLRGVDDYSDFDSLVKAAEEQDALKEIDRNLIKSRIGNQSYTQWFKTIYTDPLLTSTGEVFMHGRNYNRDKFKGKVRVILDAKIPLK